MNLPCRVVLPTLAALLLTSCYALASKRIDWESVVYSTAWGPCPTEHDCFSTWVVSRKSHTVKHKVPGKQKMYNVSKEQWKGLKVLIHKASTTDCDDVLITDVGARLTINYEDGTQLSKDVADCVYVHDADASHSVDAVELLDKWFSSLGAQP